MALVIWLAVCLAASILWRNRPLELNLAALVIWTIIPGVASSLITGNQSSSLGMHPGTWLVLTTFFTQIVTRPIEMAATLVRRGLFFLAIGLVAAVAILETKTGTSGHGVVLLTDEMLAPVLSFWMISTALVSRPEDIRTLRNCVIVLATLEALWAIAQYFASEPILFASQYEHQYWYRPGFDRWMGTTDHPLVLAVLLASSVPLLTGLRRVWLQVLLSVVMIGGVVITQSRSGLVAAGIGAIFVVWMSRTSVARKLAGTVVLAGSALAIALSSLSSGISERVANDGGSALARGTAVDFFLAHWRDYLWTGGGINTSYAVSSEAGLKSSFESAFLMYSIDIGMLFATIYFVAQLALVIVNLRISVPGAALAALIVLVLCQTFSSIEVACMVGPLLWVLLALATYPDVRPAPPSEAEDRAPTRSADRGRPIHPPRVGTPRTVQRRPVTAAS